jgi:hypothetical protein
MSIASRRFNHSLFRPIMPSDRLKAFSVDGLHALVFRLDIAETVEPLDEVVAELRDEMIRELKELDAGRHILIECPS